MLLNAFTLNQVEADHNNYILINHLEQTGPTEFIVSGKFKGAVHLNPEMPADSINAEGEQDAILIRYSIGDVPLPVELSSFQVTINNNTAHLFWQTASETNNAGFTVLHNGEELTFVDGSGTTNEPQSYDVDIKHLQPGEHTFQLKQIDFDGTIVMSKVVSVTIMVETAFMLSSAFPNPFNPRSTFTLTVAKDQEVSVMLFDMLGRQVQTLFEGQLQANQSHAFTIDGSDLTSGMYIYYVSGTQFHTYGRVILLK